MTIEKTLTDKMILNKVFRDLRKEGYIARQNYKVCQNTGWYGLSDEYNAKGGTPAVFYHRQDAKESIKDSKIVSTLYLAWQGDGKVIESIIKKHGLKVDWNGSQYDRIGILPSE